MVNSLPYGAVAQLGERYTGSVEVVSSSLIGSIEQKSPGEVTEWLKVTVC